MKKILSGLFLSLLFATPVLAARSFVSVVTSPPYNSSETITVTWAVNKSTTWAVVQCTTSTGGHYNYLGSTAISTLEGTTTISLHNPYPVILADGINCDVQILGSSQSNSNPFPILADTWIEVR